MQYAYIWARIARVQTETKAMDGQKSNPCIQEYDSSLSFPRPHCLLLIGTSTSAWYLSLSHENECLVCGQYRIIGGDRHFHTPRKFCVATIYDCRCYTTTFLSCLFSGGGGGGELLWLYTFSKSYISIALWYSVPYLLLPWTARDHWNYIPANGGILLVQVAVLWDAIQIIMCAFVVFIDFFGPLTKLPMSVQLQSLHSIGPL